MAPNPSAYPNVQNIPETAGSPQAPSSNQGVNNLLHPVVQALKIIGSSIQGSGRQPQQAQAFSQLLQSMGSPQLGQANNQPAAPQPQSPPAPAPTGNMPQQAPAPMNMPQQAPAAMPMQQGQPLAQAQGQRPLQAGQQFGRNSNVRPVSKQPVLI